MFDTSKTIAVQIFSAGLKTYLVRYPSDADWREYFRKQVVLHERAKDADGVEARSVGTEAAAAAIVHRIKVGELPGGVDEYDAAEVMRKLDYARVESAEIEGALATVSIGALRGKEGALFPGLKHLLRLPTQRQIIEYRRGSLRIVDGRQRRETRQPIEPGEQLYDALIDRVENYAGPVPANHKATVADALIGAVDALLSEADESDPEV